MRNPSLGWHLLADNLDDASHQHNGPFDRLTMGLREVIHLEELEFSEEAGEGVVEGVLQTLAGFVWVHSCSGAAGA
jgi:hypothetical protein